METELKHITLQDALMASGLFQSKSDLRRNVRQNGVKFNGVLVDEFELVESLDVDWFRCLLMNFNGALGLTKQHNTKFLAVVQKGKRNKELLKFTEDKIEKLL